MSKSNAYKTNLLGLLGCQSTRYPKARVALGQIFPTQPIPRPWGARFSLANGNMAAVFTPLNQPLRPAASFPAARIAVPDLLVQGNNPK